MYKLIVQELTDSPLKFIYVCGFASKTGTPSTTPDTSITTSNVFPIGYAQ